MSDEDEKSIILCTPTAWPRTKPMVPGTVPATADCGHEVWAAPSSKKMLDELPNALLRCIPCALESKEIKEDLEKHGLQVSPVQRRELNEVLGVGTVDQMVRALEDVRKPDVQNVADNHADD